MTRSIFAYGVCLLWLGMGEVSPQVVFLDVGQGDAAVVSGDGIHAMVDAGPRWGDFSVGGELFLQLTGLGITALDFVGLSHGDRDHWGGLPELLERMRVGRVSVHPAILPRLARVRATAMENGIRTERISRPRWSPGVDVNWWWIPVHGDRSNDRGLALLWESHGCRFLFMGDLEKEGEDHVLDRIRGPVDVLKVGHHGSRTSSAERLLKNLKPRWGIISSGAGNPYGHPHGEVLRRLTRHKIEVLRTDFHGYVRFLPKDGTLTCETAEGPCGTHRCHSRNP